ncbi:MAG TPA: glycosyltransferase family 1 protein [Acidimicrobiales bacterium]|nr:glycosyltransferase family 1 protein [Acidimicrobiales bacterium]
MKVAIDARRLQDRPLFGVGRGIANVLPTLAQEIEIVLLCDRRRASPAGFDCEIVSLPGFGPLPEIAWLQLGVPWWLNKRDLVFHGPYNAVPFASRGRTVVTIHDLSWEHHPEGFTALRRAALIVQARWSVRHADSIVTVSEFVKNQIVDTYKVGPDRIVVAPNSADPLFTPARAIDAAKVLARYGATSPYVVALGGASRRALPTSIEAWKIAVAQMSPRPHLVVVGPESPPRAPGIFHVGVLDDLDWSAVLAGAEAFCYPTRYEGFGMPALESAASGTPVVCAKVASLPEVLGSAAGWAESAGSDDIAGALYRILTDSDLRSSIRTAGLQRAISAPTWTDAANALLNAYEMAAA